jgi:hypothetical protein
LTSDASIVTFPANLDDDTAWVDLFNHAWRERDVDLAERVGRMLMARSPERHDFANALQQVRSQAGRLDSWPSPRITHYLAPNNGRSVLLKRWFEVLQMFRDGGVQRSVPIFRRIARALPEETPFAFGINLRDDAETLELLTGNGPSDQVWNPVAESGAAPRPLTVLVSGNQEYIDRYAPDFLRSASLISPGLHVHLHFCDPKVEPARQLETARLDYPSLDISGSWSDGQTMRRPVYYACARFLVAPHLMRRTMAPVLIIDVDATFNRDPGGHLSTLDLADVGLSITEGGNHWNIVKAGLVWLKPTDGGFRFANGLAAYLEAVLTSGECCWTLDQTALWTTYRHAGSVCPSAKIINLHATKIETKPPVDLARDLVSQKSVSYERSIARARARAKTKAIRKT